ncbi:MAG: hypothetical protein JO022_16775 [Acidobacteriaceae bacterium]|nr:hypothetical protein [Acidobacteriaceae bacterium]
MRQIVGRIFPFLGLGLLLCSVPAAFAGHANVNGTWVLKPTKTNFAGEEAMTTGTITISDRQHHIYISRSFKYDNPTGGFDYSFSTDGAENSTIRKGKTFTSKAKWEGDTLTVTTTQDGMTTIEHFNWTPDGTMVVMVDRPSHQSQTLFFTRQ